mmetsp:Transcript_15893/g.40154  ORF Transcript_15893/g.40154 Transcript_15893/m.40154 type:complete len:110 (+) Transcript_15893:932-1261(+)
MGVPRGCTWNANSNFGNGLVCVERSSSVGGSPPSLAGCRRQPRDGAGGKRETRWLQRGWQINSPCALCGHCGSFEIEQELVRMLADASPTRLSSHVLVAAWCYFSVCCS